MKKEKTTSIKGFQLKLAGTSVVIFLALLAASMVILNSIMENIKLELMESLSSQINVQSETVLRKMASIAQFVSTAEATQDYLLCTDELELISRKQQLDAAVSPYTDMDPQILNIIIYRANHRTPYFSRVQAENPSIFYRIASVMESANNGISFGFTVLSQPPSQNGYRSYYPVYFQRIVNISPGVDYRSFLGTVVVVLNPDFLENIVDSISPEYISSALVVDRNDNIIIDNSRSDAVALSDLELEGKVYRKQIGTTDWSLVCVMNQRLIDRLFLPFYLLLAVSFFLIFLLLLSNHLYLRTHLIRLISRLCGEIESIPSVDDGRRLSRYRVQEIDNVAERFNQLLDLRQNGMYQLIELQKKQYELETNRKITDLFALENQISPHFLLNTLACINGFSLVNNVPEISELASDLSSICRYSIRKAEVVTLQDELANAKCFFNVMRIRFQNAYKLSLNVPEEFMGCIIPKMVIQPLLENAIYHGLEKQTEGNVSVSVFRDGDDLHIVVEDDGAGIPTEKLERMREQYRSAATLEQLSMFDKRVGNINLCRRVKLLYGEYYGLDITSDGEGKGTRADMLLPFIG